MNSFTSNARARFLAAVMSACGLFFLASRLPAQVQDSGKPPERSGYVNDFAGALDPATKARLETILSNLKQRADIEFVVTTVKSVGSEDVYQYSLRLARAWDVGLRSSPRKTLLLLVTTDEAKFFTQFSKAVQQDIPDGAVGDLILRLMPQFQKREFSEGLMSGLRSFINTIGERKDFKFDDLDQRATENVIASATRPRTVETSSPQPADAPAEPAASPSPSETPTPEPSASPVPEVPARVASPTALPSETPTPEPSASPAPEVPAPVTSPTALPSETPTPEPSASPALEVPAPVASPTALPSETPTPAEVQPTPGPTATPESVQPQPTESPVPTSTSETLAANRVETKASAKKPSRPEPAEPSSPEDEKEEVELTLTKPLEQRIEILKSFIAAHPKSVALKRANELIVAAHASLGDKKLQAGDIAGGLEEFRLAFSEAPADLSDLFFREVIAHIPMNLFLRNQRAASIEFAHQAEALAKLNPRKLLALEEFYLNTENVSEANRLAELAVQQAPDLAAAHQALGAARHIALRLDDAEKEYARALELDPKSASARRSLADLKRAAGRPEEALALYREAIHANSQDWSAFAGLVISLFDAGKKEEAQQQLDAALKDENQSRNLALLVGTSYWMMAHNDAPRALELADAAVQLEPRFSWAQIARARALVANRNPLEAERSIRFARQFSGFPTLEYELASVLAAAGLYDEAVQILARSFSLKEGQIETKLAGRNLTRAANFIELLALERRAAIFQPTAADTEANARMLKGLLAFASAMNVPEGQAVKEDEALAAAQEFIAGNDAARTYRQIYVAGKLIKKEMALTSALEFIDAATTGVEAAIDLPAATIAVQAEELAEVRARALSEGSTPDVPTAPRAAISGLLRGRIEDLAGLAFFNLNKPEDAVTHLRRAVGVLPQGTPLWRAALWHLGSALEASGHNDQALLYYTRSYLATGRDPVRRAVIENVYKKVNGTLDGLDEKIGPGFNTTVPPSPEGTAPAATPTPTPTPQ